ncbi:MAG: xanthine dehydrogenase family protein molybdopterin-binding subunit [Chloroflexi bacterium]|nr:xanthine dehydrogenase family protein molybdopterin-binding subunit [Chloroflexota bacterium]
MNASRHRRDETLETLRGRDGDAARRSPPPAPIGLPVARADGRAKVTGEARYVADLTLPGLCHARLLRSPYAHARVVSIDTTAAAAHPGVVAVVTAADLPDVHLVYGHAVADHPLIADGKVRYAGEPVAGVVAEDLATATEALALIEVTYEPLPHVVDAAAALAPEAPVLHAKAGEQRPHRGFEEDIARAHPNVCSRSVQAWGDIEEAFGRAAVVVEGTYRYPMAYAYAMEPYTAMASFEAGGLTVWTSAQHPYMVRDDLARCFGLPLSAVRVVVPYVGGGYGSKSYTKIEPLTAALALRARRPVRLALSVEEAILTTRGDAATVSVRTAFDAEGRILGRDARIVLNSGAYAENSPLVARKAANRLGGPYRIPALRVESLAVYTNTAPASSFRGFGAPQATFAGESQMDEAAARLGLDALELRRRNLLSPGEPPWAKARGFDADLAADLDLAARELGWGAAAPGHGQAICVSMSDAGSEPITTAIVRVHHDGSVTLMCGSTEIGQGSATVLAQIAAGEMGVDLARVHFLNSDTAAVSYDRSTGASRTTTLMGLAIQAAARDARAQLCGWAQETLAPDGPAVVEERGGVRIGDRVHDWGAVVRAWFGTASGEVVGRGYLRRSGATAEMPPFYELGCVGIDVSVDEETGVIRVDRMVTIGDVGCAINPRLAEAQDVGAAIMGLGMAMREELLYDEAGNLLNGNLFDYRVPRFSDVPEMRPLLAERRDGVGPYGAKGGGEGALNPVAAAIANAVERAAGIRLREAPFTPERVWRALRERDSR